METKVLIRKGLYNNIVDALTSYLDSEKIEYVVTDNLNHIEKDITHLIYIGDDMDKDELSIKEDIPIILVSDTKKVIEGEENVINYIVTGLVSDSSKYTDVQKEYLFKKGIYHLFLQRIGELLGNEDNYNGMIYDMTEIKLTPYNWIFRFDSISDTYYWLSKKNRSMKENFTRKAINFCSDKVYDDSLREINYLTEKIMDIKEKRKSIDLFIGTKEELKILKNNYFFKALLKNISPTYHIYLIDKKRLEVENPSLLEDVLDGICIYDDCIYRDTYDDEISLGYVDCNKETITLYNRYFEELMNQYGYKISSESDMNEFLK